MWREADIEPNTAMLADPDSGRFITADGKPVTDAFVGWRNAAIMSGHWVLHGVGMFVVEEKATGQFAGRVGPWLPPGWPGFEIGWGIAREFRGKGYALEAARASIDWASRVSTSIESSTASTVKTPRPKAWRGGSGPGSSARWTCSAMPPTSG